MKKILKGVFSLLVITTMLNINIKENRDIEAVENVGICDQMTADGGFNDKCGDGEVTFVNSSFEEPAFSSSFNNQPASRVPGWETTSTNDRIEVWSSEFAVRNIGTACQDGNLCVEINSNEPASLYQDFQVRPGQYIYYSFYHMGRDPGIETLELRMGKPNDASDNKLNPTMNGVEDRVLESEAQRGVWAHRFGFYQVPNDFASDGETTLRIAFLSTSGSSNSSSRGNLIDNIEFYTVAVYDNNVTISEPVGGVSDPATDEFLVTNTLMYLNRDILASSESSVTYTLTGGVELVPGSVTVEGVSHLDVTTNGDEIVITNLPEKYEDINIEYKVRFSGAPNVARIHISSFFQYASKIVVENFPEDYGTFDITDTESLNVSYNDSGYCDLITANNGYSTDCGEPTNIVYDNQVEIIDNNPTLPLGSKSFTIKNVLVNLNHDKDLDEATSTLTYTYKNNMLIDFSSLQVNGVAHTDYTNTIGTSSNVLEITNLPDIGIDNYEITFNTKYDFTKSHPLLRDVFTKEFLVVSRLDYKNEGNDSYVSDKAQRNLSYASSITLTSTLTDATGNSKMQTGEVLSSTVGVTNESSFTVNNVALNLVNDTSKLSTSISNVVVKSGTTTLTLDTDYTISGTKVILNKMTSGEVVNVTYDVTALSSFSNDKSLNNTISVFADEYKVGTYLLQVIPVDITASSSISVTSSVTDNHNGKAGNEEVIQYTYTVTNTGSYDITNVKISDVQDSSILDVSTLVIELRDNNGNVIPNTAYTFNNLTLDVKHTIKPGETLKVVGSIKTISDVGVANIENTFLVVATTKTGDNLEGIETTSSIPVSKNPEITSQDFVVLNQGDSFNLSTYASSYDEEDGNVSDKLTYTPAINTSIPGVYKISVVSIDSDRRSDTETMIVLVDDGNFVYGDNRIIYAKDFERYVSQVVVDSNVVKNAAGVFVYDKATAAVLNNNVTVDLGSYKAVAGQYDITFSVSDELTTKTTITATVNSSNPPSIIGTTFKEINVGDSFDPLTGVSATDDFDGNITSKVTVTGTYDVNTAGVYTLTYSVKDADNNTTTVKRVLLVNDGNYSVGTTYILRSQNFTRRVGEVTVSEEAVIVAASSAVYDKQTGERVTRRKTAVLGSYDAVVGEYPITVSIVSDPTAKRDITATVVTGDLPVLNVEEFTEINVGDSINLKAGMTATDTEDVDLYSYIDVSGTVDVDTAGIYKVEYSVTDSDSNTVTKTRVVLVNDGSYEVGDSKIIQANNFYKLTTDVDTADNAVITDADAKLYEKSTGEISSESLVVNQNGYSSTIAIYSIEFSVASDPSVVKTISANVSNGNDPVITARSFVEIPKGSTFNVMNGVSATDIEDGNLTSSITVDNPVDTTTAGIYVVKYSVTDSTGNTTTFDTVVLINDGKYKVGTTEIIYAAGFKNLISEVDTSDSAIIADAGAELFSKATGASLGTTNIVVNKGSYTNVAGQYDVVFTSSSDASVTRTVKATVSQGEAPVLTVDEFVEINVGDEFIELEYATAEDAESGDVTPLISFSTNVNENVPGFYKVTYEVNDFDGNIDTAEMSVLVNDGTYVAGDYYVIQATGFSNRVSQVSLKIPNINSSAKVKVYDRLTGLEITEPYTTDIGTYKAVVGNYDIVFTVDQDTKATITVNAEVTAGDSPVITGEKITEVPLNGTFDRTAGISATDTEDGDVSSIGRIEGRVNTTVPAIYTLKYYVTDSDGNYTEFVKYVIVNDGSFTITDRVVVRAFDFTVRVGEVDTETGAINTQTEFEMFDIATETTTTLPYTLNTGDYRAKVGTYSLGYVVIDGEYVINHPVTAEVIAGNAPEIITDQYVVVEEGVGYDVTANVTASDAEDGDITTSIIVSTDFDPNTVGVYTARYVVTDSDNNSTSFIKVIVVGENEHTIGDTTIMYAVDFELYVSEVDTSDKAIKTESEYKMYSKLTGELLTDLRPPTIETDYTAIEGEYPVTFTIDIDPAITHTITATVLAGEEPVITGDSLVVINVGSEFVITDHVSASDLEDGDISNSITINQNIDMSIPGVYKVIYTVTDVDNNSVTYEQVVVVDDGNFTITDDYIIYKKDFTISEDQVKVNKYDIIESSELAVYTLDGNLVDNSGFSVDYNGYTSKPGNYTVYFTIGQNELGEDIIVAVNITVTEVEDLVKTGLQTKYIVSLLILLIVFLTKKIYKIAK